MSSFTEVEGWSNHEWQLFDSEFFPRTKIDGSLLLEYLNKWFFENSKNDNPG
jgi:hypothetical protein